MTLEKIGINDANRSKDAMKCLIADDEELILKDIRRTAVKVLGEGTDFYEAMNSDAVLKIVKENNIQIVFLDIEMPYISGLEVAKKIMEIKPRTNIIIVTGHAKYALDILEMYVSGFIMKPVNEKSMRRAIENLRHPIAELTVKCFGDFEVFYGGEPVNFKRSQCKEVFAYLIDKQGAFVSEDELRYLLWTEEADTDKKRRYVRNIISDIRAALKACDVEDVIINNNKSCYAVKRDKISCDLYDYLDGKLVLNKNDTKNYMKQFSWGGGRRLQKTIKISYECM